MEVSMAIYPETTIRNGLRYVDLRKTNKNYLQNGTLSSRSRESEYSSTGKTSLPIELKDYLNIKEKQEKTDRELLRYFKMDQTYTTNDIQKFLCVNNAATLGRLKKLKRGGFVGLKVVKRIYHWYKIKDMEEKQIMSGWLFG
jgi:hypothetical protein